MVDISHDVFGILKPLVDVHTLGISTLCNLLRDCGLNVKLASDSVNEAIQNLQKLDNYGLLKKWILDNGITRLGFSYRLDPKDGAVYFLVLYKHLNDDKMFSKNKGPLKDIFFAGLPDTCKMIKANTDNMVKVFPGDETPVETLTKLGVPKALLPKSLTLYSEYDDVRWNFAKKLVTSEKYKLINYQDHYGYNDCGTDKDLLFKRIQYAKSRHSLPIIRAHVGPYNPNRLEALKEFKYWVQDLAKSKLLDVLSIGSSQLTQSNFGEDWEGKPNGGGIPVNSEIEYNDIKESAKPMLVRTYSGTKNVPELARIHERSLNISWHAFSFWWFCELDGRGPNTLLQNLKEHFEALKYIATTNKPVEPNVPHHFAFRGSDDISFIISGFLAAKAIKKAGIKLMVLQDMLNTPKHTIGLQDLAKGRTLLRLVRQLEDSSFKVYLQLRAGLDYFSPDEEKAKVQLAAVTALMDDLEPENDDSPEIIHVVSYSEAIRLATPPIIKDSIKITLSALDEYRIARKNGEIPNLKYNIELRDREERLYFECSEAIKLLEQYIPNLYTPEGFYKVFVNGFLPVPYLIDPKQKFPKARYYQTALKDGGIRVVDDKGNIINTVDRYKNIIRNMN